MRDGSGESTATVCDRDSPLFAHQNLRDKGTSSNSVEKKMWDALGAVGTPDKAQRGEIMRRPCLLLVIALVIGRPWAASADIVIGFAAPLSGPYALTGHRNE